MCGADRRLWYLISGNELRKWHGDYDAALPAQDAANAGCDPSRSLWSAITLWVRGASAFPFCLSLCLVCIHNAAERAKIAAYACGPAEDFSVQARTKAWLDGMALAAGLAKQVGMCIESPELLLPRLMHVSALRAKRKAEKNAALVALIGSGSHSPDGGDAMDLSELLETGSDDVIAAVACAAGVFEIPKVVDDATSASFTQELAGMVRQGLGADGVELVVSADVVAPPDPEPELPADAAGGSDKAVAGSMDASDEKSIGECSWCCALRDCSVVVTQRVISRH